MESGTANRAVAFELIGDSQFNTCGFAAALPLAYPARFAALTRAPFAVRKGLGVVCCGFATAALPLAYPARFVALTRAPFAVRKGLGGVCCGFATAALPLAYPARFAVRKGLVGVCELTRFVWWI